MTRIKGGILHRKRRAGILKHTKGFMWGRKSKIKLAKIAKYKAGQYAFVSRKTKKRDRRAVYNIKINAAVRKHDLSYSRFIDALKKKGIMLDRKVLSKIAVEYPKVFDKIIEAIK